MIGLSTYRVNKKDPLPPGAIKLIDFGPYSIIVTESNDTDLSARAEKASFDTKDREKEDRKKSK